MMGKYTNKETKKKKKLPCQYSPNKKKITSRKIVE